MGKSSDSSHRTSKKKRVGILSVPEQMKRMANRTAMSLALESKLQLLAEDILAGNKSKVAEFQQMVQFAPVEMKTRMLQMIDGNVKV